MKTLNINKIYEAYDKNDFDTIGQEVYGVYKQSSSFIDEQAIVWDESINFYEGKHHYIYDRATKSYKPRPVTKFNRHIPRPTTNFIFPTTNAVVSLLSRNRPNFKMIENSDRPEDKNRAALGDQILDTKYEMDEELIKHIWAMKVAAISGHVYRKDWWDTTGLQQVKFKEEKKQEDQYSSKKEVKKRYENEEEVKEDQYDETVKEDKETEEFRTVPLGDNRVTMLTPFQMLIDYENSVTSLDDSMFVGEVCVQNIDYIKESYDKKGKGYTGVAKDIKAEKNLSLRMDYFERRKGSSTKGSTEGEKPATDNSTVLIEMYIRPNLKHKKGLMIVCAGSDVLYAYDSPYTYSDGLNWHPYNDFKYDEDPFRHYGMSMVEQIVPLNRRINAIDSLTILNRKTNASPQMIVPHGSLTPEQYPTGAPGEIIPAKPVNGLLPHKLPGMALSSGVSQERQNVVQELYIVSGVNEIMVGSQPSGVGTATALQILLEQTNNKFGPMLQRLSKFIEKGQTKKINLIRRKYKEPRADLINRVKAMNKDNLEVQIDDLFTGEALGDNLDVRVEGESMMPRSSVVDRSTLMELLNLQLFGDISPEGNPVGNAEILRKFNAPNIPVPGSTDRTRSEWENDQLRQSKFDEVQVLPTDNPIIHFKEVRKEIVRPEFYETNDKEVIDAFWVHLLEHFVRIPQQAYEMLRLTPAQVEEYQQFALQYGIEPLEEVKTLEDRVGQLEGLAQEMMQATAGVEPSGVAAPVPEGAGGLPMDIPVEGLPPEMA